MFFLFPHMKNLSSTAMLQKVVYINYRNEPKWTIQSFCCRLSTGISFTHLLQRRSSEECTQFFCCSTCVYNFHKPCINMYTMLPACKFDPLRVTSLLCGIIIFSHFLNLQRGRVETIMTSLCTRRACSSESFVVKIHGITVAWIEAQCCLTISQGGCGVSHRVIECSTQVKQL